MVQEVGIPLINGKLDKAQENALSYMFAILVIYPGIIPLDLSKEPHTLILMI